MEVQHPLPAIEDIIRPIKKAPQIRSDHDIFLIQEVTKDIPFFQKYIQEGKGDVHQKSCKHMTYEKFENGDMVFSQGDKGSKFYIILEGTVGIYIKIKNELKKVKELNRGESFGELALINDAPRSASIKCIQDCHFAVLDKKNYITLFQQILDNEIKKEVSFYPEIELFSSWNYNKIKSFYNHSFRIKLKKGDRIISESDPIDAIYIIVTGEFVVKKKIVNESDSFKKRGDLQQLKRMNTTLASQLTHNLFIMSPYEIFGQENSEEEDPRFFYSVDCHSFEGNLIYIKIQDYMKVIMKDESQKQYMQNYSQRRVQRVQNRIKEVTSALNLTAIKNDDNEDIKRPFERNQSKKKTTFIAPVSESFENENDFLQDRITVPEVKRGIKKRKTCIDALGDENTISKSNNKYLSENGNPNGIVLLSEEVPSYEQKGSRLNSLSVIPSNTPFKSFTDFGKEQFPQKSQTRLGSIESSSFQQILKVKTKFQNTNTQSFTNSPYTHNSDGNNNKQDEDSEFKNINTPLSLNASNNCYTPVSLRKSLSILPPKKVGTLSNFGEVFSPTKPSANKNASPQLNDICSIYDLEDEEQIPQNTASTKEGTNQKIIINLQKYNGNLNKQLKSQLQHKISFKHKNADPTSTDNENEEEEDEKQKKTNTYYASQQPSLKKIGSMSQSSVMKIAFKEDSSPKQKTLKKQNSAIEQADQEYEQLHPLVKGFHEQLKVRFYNKFKNGSIEDLKNHLDYSPIQTLQLNRFSPETLKNGLRPAIFSNKRKQESKTKEIREYEQKLKLLIKSDCEVPLECISPMNPRGGEKQLLNLKQEQQCFGQNSISPPHLKSPSHPKSPSKDSQTIKVKKSLLNIFSTTVSSKSGMKIFNNNSYTNSKNNNNNINNNSSSNQQLGGSLLHKQLSNENNFISENPPPIRAKHHRIGSLDTNVGGVYKLLQLTTSTKNQINIHEEKSEITNTNQPYFPNISSTQQLGAKNSPISSKLKELFQQNVQSDNNKSTLLISNLSQNEIVHPSEMKQQGFFTPTNPKTKVLDKYNQFIVSNRVGFRGQKGFNCSQFNLRKDKSTYYTNS